MAEFNNDINLNIPDPWRDIAERIGGSPGLVMVLGGCDTGKSTLCMFLVRHLCGAGARVGFVDSDVGQSTLGPPMTIGGKVYTMPADVRPDLHPPCLFFTGSATPVGRMVESIEGTVRVVQRVRGAGAKWIVVDTTGMIAGEAGRQIKLQKVRLLRPDWVVVLERDSELQEIVPLLEREGQRILRIHVPAEVKRRSREQRRRRRFESYAEYFRNAVPIEIEIERIPVYDLQSETPAGTLAGLNDRHGDTLALGYVAALDLERGIVSLNAPPLDVRNVAYLKLADVASDRIDYEVVKKL
ncbi:MAG: polynucleotide 5'-hydroxyl-kinase [Planctomycetota bacterium]